MENTTHKIKNCIIGETRHIYVVGVGGTGSYLVEGLAKILVGYKLTNIKVTLVDPDVVEEKNLLRQNFRNWEIGAFKADALASRINQDFGVDFHSYVGRGEDIVDSYDKTLLVTCVDSFEVRKKFKTHPHWIDMGNGLDFGQACYGNTHDAAHIAQEIESWEKSPIVKNLPSPYLVLELNRKAPKKKQNTSCADMPFAEQGCLINNWSALAGLNLIHQILINHSVTTPAVWFNSKSFRMSPAKITKDFLSQFQG